MSETKKKLVLKKLSQYNTIWHPESTMVFKSIKERVVIGRLEDEELKPIDNICKDACKEWNFVIEESPETSNDEGENEEEHKEVENEDEHKEVEDQDEHKEVEDQDEQEEEEEDDDEEEEEKEEVKEENVSTVLDTKSSDRATRVLSKISSVAQEISVAVNQYEEEISKLKNDLENSQAKNQRLEQELDSMRAKFTALKSIFS